MSAEPNKKSSEKPCVEKSKEKRKPNMQGGLGNPSLPTASSYSPTVDVTGTCPSVNPINFSHFVGSLGDYATSMQMSRPLGDPKKPSSGLTNAPPKKYSEKPYVEKSKEKRKPNMQGGLGNPSLPTASSYSPTVDVTGTCPSVNPINFSHFVGSLGDYATSMQMSRPLGDPKKPSSDLTTHNLLLNVRDYALTEMKKEKDSEDVEEDSEDVEEDSEDVEEDSEDVQERKKNPMKRKYNEN